MSIPLDRLYHYIEGVAKGVYDDDILIYRFYPHGSKNIENLSLLTHADHITVWLAAYLYCNDQEPLNYDLYQVEDVLLHPAATQKRALAQQGFPLPATNFRIIQGVYDKALLLHSEKRSTNLERYLASDFISVYYWSHAVIALDWFRFANHVTQTKKIKHTFLIYNRAWSGTREYRLKFVDLLVTHQLHSHCNIKFNAVEPEERIHYTDYTLANPNFLPLHDLEKEFPSNEATSCASADFDLADYEAADFEVVLETLFDDGRLHLTEKTLRPIALGQPFILAATHGSLEYIRSYGFKTFDGIIDESYDTIKDPLARLEAITKTMLQIQNWSASEREEKLSQLKQITEYNKTYFFSKEFFELITTELKNNLKSAIDEVESTNTGELINRRKRVSSDPVLYNTMTGKVQPSAPRSEIAKVVKKARKYYMRTLGQD